MRFVMV